MKRWDCEQIRQEPQGWSGLAAGLVLMVGFCLALLPEIAFGAITSLSSDPPAPTCVEDVYLSVSGYFFDYCWKTSYESTLGNETVIAYNAAGQPVSVRDPLGNVSELLRELEDPAGGSISCGE